MIVVSFGFSLKFCAKNESRRQKQTVLRNASLNLVSNRTSEWLLKSEISDKVAVNGLMDKNEFRKNKTKKI